MLCVNVKAEREYNNNTFSSTILTLTIMQKGQMGFEKKFKLQA